jgi:hypothetical protein
MQRGEGMEVVRGEGGGAAYGIAVASNQTKSVAEERERVRASKLWRHVHTLWDIRYCISRVR